MHCTTAHYVLLMLFLMTKPLSTDKHLTMLFEGGTTKQGLSFIILMGTGASANFISPQLLKRLQLECQPADAKLRLADNTEAPLLGKVQLRLKIQQISNCGMVLCYRLMQRVWCDLGQYFYE